MPDSKLFITTSRLILREINQNDINDMYRLDSNSLVHEYLGPGWMNQSIKDAEENVMSIINQYKERGIGRWAVIEKSTGNFIGWSGLKLNFEENLEGLSEFYDIGYRLLPEYWGKGYATESSLASLEYGFNTLHLDTIYGITHIENEASHRVLLKIGLKLVKTFNHKDVTFKLRWYQITKDEHNKNMP